MVIPDEGLKLTIKNLKYLVDWDGNNKNDINGGAHTPDGELYCYCNFVSSPSNIKEAYKLQIEYNGPTGGDSNAWGGPGNITFEYTDVFGKPSKYVQNVEPQYYPQDDEVMYELSIFYDSSKPFKVINNLKTPWNYIQPILSNDVNSDFFTVDVESQEIEIEGGNYDPEDLVVVLNRQLQANNPTGGELVNSPVLTSTEASGASSKKFVNFTQTKAFQTNDKSYWVGTSDFEFSYIPNSKQFSVNRIHMAFYESGNEAVGFIPLAGKDKLITKNSGIMFTDLQAELRTSGTQYPFWNETLGFNLDRTSDDCILTTFTSVTDTLGGAPVQLPRITRFVDGVNMTSGFSGLNAVVIKNGTFNIAPTSIPASGIFSTSQDVTPIIGKASSLNAQDAFGYFLVEVKAGFGNDFFTSDNNARDIRAIVSRYYSVNSYTSGSEGDSIVYRHKGDTMMLSSFKIRILDSLKNVATNIGEDNTVFLGIVKAGQKALGPK